MPSDSAEAVGPPQHFLNMADIGAERLRGIIASAAERKRAWKQGERDAPLAGKTVAMLFAMPSTRTRVSFEAGVGQLGGNAMYIDISTTQLARSEPIADTAKVFGSMCEAVVIRHGDHGLQTEFAASCGASVVNALSSVEHPCQVLADVMTFEEERGPIAGAKVAWIGDCNNVCNSWIAAAGLFGFELAVASPAGFDQPGVEVPGSVSICSEPMEAAQGAACVVTDVWRSMGDQDAASRREAFAGFTVGSDLMGAAAEDAIFMHCLPAHRGEEVDAEVIDGPASVVWAEAENRLHAQKALLVDLLA